MSDPKYYTGVGSRSTPNEILDLMEQTARELSSDGWVLRSGGADGADTAFEKGADESRIFFPWETYGDDRSISCSPARTRPADAAFDLIADIHPAWDRLSEPVQILHARNAHQVLGDDLQTPSSFVICWTPDGASSEEECDRDTGGTATAIRLADRMEVPVRNLANSSVKKSVQSYVQNDGASLSP